MNDYHYLFTYLPGLVYCEYVHMAERWVCLQHSLNNVKGRVYLILQHTWCWC